MINRNNHEVPRNFCLDWKKAILIAFFHLKMLKSALALDFWIPPRLNRVKFNKNYWTSDAHRKMQFIFKLTSNRGKSIQKKLFWWELYYLTALSPYTQIHFLKVNCLTTFDVPVSCSRSALFRFVTFLGFASFLLRFSKFCPWLWEFDTWESPWFCSKRRED